VGLGGALGHRHQGAWSGPGDHFGGFFNYGVGAAAYSGGSNLSSPGLFGGGNQVALGVITDGVFVNGGS